MQQSHAIGVSRWDAKPDDAEADCVLLANNGNTANNR